MAGGIGSGHGMVPIDDDVSLCCIRIVPSYTSAMVGAQDCSLELRNPAMLLLLLSVSAWAPKATRSSYPFSSLSSYG